MDSLETLTFVCLGANQVATLVDVQPLPPSAARAHAIGLLREHASAQSVEIWSGDAVIALVDRQGARFRAGRGSEASAPRA